MIGLLIYIIILLIVFGVLFWAVDLIAPIPPNLRIAIKVLLALVLVLILLEMLLGGRLSVYLPRYP